MSNFIPLTGSPVNDIIKQFLQEPGFDVISYSDAQEVTGQLFRELIGPDFEPYKNLATFADIQAIQAAIDLIDANSNAQKIIAGTQIPSFMIDPPVVNVYPGDDFALIAVSAQSITPEASFVQYSVNDGAYVTMGNLTLETGTFYAVLTDLTPDTQLKIQARQFTPNVISSVATKFVNTTPTAAKWNEFFNNVAIREAFYTDSYTNNIFYGISSPKTAMQWIFSSRRVVDELYVNSNTISIIDSQPINITTLAASEQGMLGLANNMTGFEHAIASQAYMTAIDNIDLATRILILEQTATQDYTQFASIGDFVNDQTAMAEIAASQNAMRALVAGVNVEQELVLEPIALNEVFANLVATIIMANDPTAVTAIAESPTAMAIVDENDELLRILLLELTNLQYTQFATVADLFLNENDIVEIFNTPTSSKIILQSATAINSIFENDLATKILYTIPFNFDYTLYNNTNTLFSDASYLLDNQILNLVRENKRLAYFMVDNLNFVDTVLQNNDLWDIYMNEGYLITLFFSSENIQRFWNNVGSRVYDTFNNEGNPYLWFTITRSGRTQIRMLFNKEIIEDVTILGRFGQTFGLKLPVIREITLAQDPITGKDFVQNQGTILNDYGTDSNPDFPHPPNQNKTYTYPVDESSTGWVSIQMGSSFNSSYYSSVVYNGNIFTHSAYNEGFGRIKLNRKPL